MTPNEIPFKEFRYTDKMKYNNTKELYDYLKHIYETKKIILYYIGGADRLAKIMQHVSLRPEFEGYWCRNKHIAENVFNDVAESFRGFDDTAYYFVKKDHPFAAFGKTFKSCNEIVKVITI
jgi:hypothetical protein